uniref:Uncharacterized protein n=1 Tax=Romanomermis culicivorax TaxID=13658 RepID=A0A915KVC3_ROMCU
MLSNDRKISKFAPKNEEDHVENTERGVATVAEEMMKESLNLYVKKKGPPKVARRYYWINAR